MQDEIGRQVGDYQILREIGRGGMGVVYQARRKDGAVVALKVLSSSRANDEDAVRRFLREGEIARRLDHVNIVRIHEVGKAGDLCYIAMDLHLGPNLEDLVFELRRGRRDALAIFLPDFPETETPVHETDEYQRAVTKALADVAKAVEYAHQKGLIHRDIKPGNMLIAGPRRLLLTDFGLVRELDSETQTLTGDLLGTPLYMSPEQIMGRRDQVGPRSDVYALGATLHECLGLQAPYDAQDITRLARQIETDEARDLAQLNPSLPKVLVTITRRAMSKRPEDRYAGAALFADDLDRFVAGRSIVARPPDSLEILRNILRRRPDLVAITATLLIAALIFGGVLFWRDRVEKVRRSDEAQRAFMEGQEHLGRGTLRAAWSSAAEAESLAPTAVYAQALRAAVEAAYQREFNGLLVSGLDGLLQIEALIAMLGELPGNSIDLAQLRVRWGQERRRALGLGALQDDERLDRIFSAYAVEHPEDLPELRRDLAPSFTRVFGEKMARFAFVEASKLAERAQRWGVKLAPTSGVPKAAGDLTRPGHMELQSIASELFGPDRMVRRRALVRLSDPATFVRLPWRETERLFSRFLDEVNDEASGREFIRLADRLALPCFGKALVNLVRRFPELEPALIELAGRHPDPALTEFLFAAHEKSGRRAMDPAIVGALRAADMEDIRKLARQLECWNDFEPEALRLLLFVLDRRELPDLDRKLDELADRIRDPARLAPIFEVLARRGRELDPELTLPLLDSQNVEVRVALAAALPAEAFESYVAPRLVGADPEEAQIALRMLFAAPEKGERLLLQILDGDQLENEARALALYALGELKDSPVELRLIDASTSPSVMLRRSALSGLARKDGSDRRGGRFETLLTLARERLTTDRSPEVRAAAVDLVSSISGHELAGELTQALRGWQPDAAVALIGRLFGNRAGDNDVVRLMETFGVAPLRSDPSSRTVNREILAIAICKALGRLGLDAGWEAGDSRDRAAEALLDTAGREDISLELARSAWEALDSFRDQLPVEDLVAVARGLSRAEVAAVAGCTLLRREAAVAAAGVLEELPISSPSSRAVAALALFAQGDFVGFEEQLVRAWVSGFRDMDALGQREALRAGSKSSAVREIDRRLRTERLVD